MGFLTVFDFESGGLEPRHPSIQLAAVVINETDWREVASFERKISFNEADADPAALALNHYDAEVWKRESKPPAIVAAEFAAFAKPYASIQMVSKRNGTPYQVGKLCGHNASVFDLPRLREMFGTNFFPFSYHALDSLQRALFFFDEHPERKRPDNLKLGTLCAHFGIPTDGAHGALADVKMCAALVLAFRKAERGG